MLYIITVKPYFHVMASRNNSTVCSKASSGRRQRTYQPRRVRCRHNQPCYPYPENEIWLFFNRRFNIISVLMTSSNGNIFRVTGHLSVEFTGQRWIPRTKASDTKVWCFFFICNLNKRLSKQSWGGWFEMPSRPLWRHCNGVDIHKTKTTLRIAAYNFWFEWQVWQRLIIVIIL